jgi:hypothetical protein
MATGRLERSRQSSNSAHPARPIIEVYWSRMPQLTPTNRFSARWQIRAVSTGSRGWPASAMKTVAAAHSSAADELSPLPMGIVESTNPSQPCIG